VQPGTTLTSTLPPSTITQVVSTTLVSSTTLTISFPPVYHTYTETSTQPASTLTTVLPASSYTYTVTGIVTQTATATEIQTVTATPSPPPLSCPSANGTYFGTSAGTFIVECYLDRAGADIDMIYAGKLENCMTGCAANARCVALSYVLTDNGGDYSCYLHGNLQPGLSDGRVWGARLLSPNPSTTTVVVTSLVTVTPAASAAPT